MLNGKRRQPVPGPLCSSYAQALPVLDDLTDARLAADTRAHLAGCAWCRAQRAAYDHFDEALRLHFAPDALPFLPIHFSEFSMPDIHDAVSPAASSDEAALDDGTPHLTVSPLPVPPQPPRHSWRLVTGAASLAAVLMISLLAGLIFLSHDRSLATVTGKATPTNIPDLDAQLAAISMSSPTDGWAMGYGPSGDSEDATYVLHYIDGRWIRVHTPIRASINAIKMFSPTDGWAVGNKVYHYDGHSWREIHVQGSVGFTTIAAVSPTNIWISGSGEAGAGAIILHYDGYGWFRQALPSVLFSFSVYDLSMVSATDGWAVGVATPVPDGSGYDPPTSVILHYSNGSWALAKTLPNVALNTISMGSATTGWIGGEKQVRNTQFPAIGPFVVSQKPALWHYTHGQWVEVAVPQPTNSGGILPDGEISNITMFSATNGWMFAALNDAPQTLDGSTTLTPDVYHLVQGRWVQIATPVIQHRRSVYMSHVAFVSPDEFWGVGNSWLEAVPDSSGDGSTSTITPLIVHYKSGVWDVIQGAD